MEKQMRIIKTSEIEGLKVVHAIDDEEQSPEQYNALWAELFRLISSTS